MATLFGSDILDDTLTGGVDNDVIYGGADGGTGGGNDLLTGGGGADSLFGGLGDDTFMVDASDLTVVGGAEVDTAIYTAGADVIGDGRSIVVEHVELGAGNDVFTAVRQEPPQLSTLGGSAGFQLNGSSVHVDYTGRAVSSAGDLNGDGFDDVVVGAPLSGDTPYGVGASYVVFGKAAGWTSAISLTALNGANGFRLEG